MKKTSYLISVLYLGGLIILWLTSFWPWRFWWLANAIQITPLWIWGLPLIVFFLADLVRRNRNLFILHALSFLIIFFGIMGYKLPTNPSSQKTKLNVSVLTANLGEGGDITAFSGYIKEIKPDIIAFQEVEHHQRSQIKGVLPEGWNVVFNEHLGVASRFKIKDFETKNRRFLGDWGGVIGRAELNAGVMGVINFFTVHLDSPRDGLEAILHKRMAGIEEMRKVTENQVAESIMASKWAGSFSNIIVSGDFNMLDSNPIYQKYWSKFRNAFALGGEGFGYTKFTRWHGVRIDHVLFDKNWKVLSVETGMPLGGDHRPVTARLAFIGEVLKDPLPDNAEVYPKFSADEKIFMFEGFDENPGNFYKFSDAELAVDRNEKFKHGKSLKIQSKPLQNYIAAGVNLERLPIDQFADVSFAYKIPNGVAVGIRVKTQFDDWICIGGTPSNLCPHPKAREASVLTDDGQWHEVSLDIKNTVRSVLPAVKYVKEFQFYVHQTRSLYDQFWIDDFLIKD